MKKNLRFILFSLFSFPFSLFLFIFSYAQAPATSNSADIFLQLKKLNVLGSVLYIAAHPDDENTRLLAYFAKEKKYRTGYLSLTRGDGGQNLIGDEQGIELGLIRTQELLSARRIDGAEQFFSRACDFGYSKTADETFRIWGHDKILSDVVWVIRKFQPDVIITRFPGDARAGHGQHWASALLANEAFKDAADPARFPEQLQYGVHPWQAKRILWNTFQFGNANTTSEDQYKIDVGVYNNLLGKSYGEIASESRSQHKSQGFGIPRQRGQANEYFLVTGGDAPKNDLLDGVTATWKRMEGSDDIQNEINEIIAQYSFEHPENSVDALVKLYQSAEQLPDSYWKNKKLAEVQELIIACSGLFAEATSANEFAVQGDSIHVQFFVNKRNNHSIALKKIQLRSFDSSINKDLLQNQNFFFNKAFHIAIDEKISQPYWLEKPLDNGGSFDVSDQQLIGKAQNDAAYSAKLTFTIDGLDLIIDRPVMYKFTDPVKGEVYEPLFVIPAITGSLDQPVYVLNGMKQRSMQLLLHGNDSFNEVNAQITAGNEWKIEYGSFRGVLNKDATQIINSAILATSAMNSTELNIQVTASSNGVAYNQPVTEERKIAYDHIPDIIYFKPLTARLKKIDVITKGKYIGYITGAGDKVPQALQQLGYNIIMLNEVNITDENLKQFDAVITGVRAYNVHDWLYRKYDILMRYVKNGGNMIVQYNTGNFISTISSGIGPYPFAISRTRVTEETAEMRMLLPDHPVFNYPNRITSKDFENWIQERSIYQAEQSDPKYAALFGMHDANETESNGSLIIAPYGKGNFAYTGLVFFRELPAGVPGAYRLMANLIALPKNK